MRSAFDWLTYRRDRVARQLARDQEFLRRSQTARSQAAQNCGSRSSTLDVTVSERERQTPPEW